MHITMKLLRIKEMMALLDCSSATIDRWCDETRQGRNDFVLPYTTKGKRRYWVADAVYDWILRRQSIANQPPINITTAKQRKKQEREFQERQQRADAGLERHRNHK